MLNHSILIKLLPISFVRSFVRGCAGALFSFLRPQQDSNQRLPGIHQGELVSPGHFVCFAALFLIDYSQFLKLYTTVPRTLNDSNNEVSKQPRQPESIGSLSRRRMMHPNRLVRSMEPLKRCKLNSNTRIDILLRAVLWRESTRYTAPRADRVIKSRQCRYYSSTSNSHSRAHLRIRAYDCFFRNV